MSPFLISFLSFLCIFSGTMLGFYLGKRLPEKHLSTESKDTVKMAWGIVATMSALVLGLLVASAKGSFDTINGESTDAGAKVIMLDHVLARYGADAAPIRHDLREGVALALKTGWHDDDAPERAPSDQEGGWMEQVVSKLRTLPAGNDDQRAIVAQARQLADGLFLERVLVGEQIQSDLPPVLIIALVIWLSILFVGISLFAPRNTTVVVTLVLCCFSLSAAIFLITDLSHPLHGLIQVPDRPLREALNVLNAAGTF